MLGELRAKSLCAGVLPRDTDCLLRQAARSCGCAGLQPSKPAHIHHGKPGAIGLTHSAGGCAVASSHFSIADHTDARSLGPEPS